MSYNVNNTYVYFDVLDFTGTNTLSAFTLENTPLQFVPDFTTSSLLSANSIYSISNKNIRWDFGDGSFSTDLRPKHVYKWPGQYTVTLTVYDNYGNAYDSLYTRTIQVYDYISSQISFRDYKGLIYDVPAGRLLDPLYIDVYSSWQNYSALSATGYTINLYASGARGDYNYTPLDITDKWDHLRSLSRFYRQNITSTGDIEYLEIESLTATQTEIYVNIQNNQIQQCSQIASGSVLAGITGTCQVWYTDDRPGNLTTESNPVFLFATIDSSKFNDAYTQKMNTFEYVDYPIQGLQNLDPAVFPSVKIRYNVADRLSITTTGIDGEGTLSTTKFNIPSISWQDTEIPYVIKFKDKDGFTTKNYPPLSSSITKNTASQPSLYYDVQTSIITLSGNTYVPLDGVTYYEDFVPGAPQSLGAFYKGYFIPTQSSENCVLTASVTVLEPAHYQKDALVGWVAIPQYNSALRILRQEYYNGMNGSKYITLANNDSTLSVNDNRNIYAIAVSPAGTEGSNNDYQTWFADAINDKIVKYDMYGNLLSDYYTLSATPTLFNNQIVSIDYRSTATNNILPAAAPNNITLDGDENVWVTLLESGTAIKIDTSIGAVTFTASPTAANYSYTLSSDYISQDGFAGENLFLPSSIDTDVENNVWIAYSHPNFNYLIKYRGNNNYTTAAETITEVQFPDGITPDEICVDRNKNVWVTAVNHNNQGSTFDSFNDYLYKFNTNGDLIDGFPLSGFKQIGNITVDGHQNAWVAHNKETITKIDGITNKRADYIAGRGTNKTNYICSIGGLTCDTSNYIWVINNFDKKLYIIDGDKPPRDFFEYITSVDLEYPAAGLPGIPPGQYSDGMQEFQAIGDWNGYKWINKYATRASTTRTITGASNIFNIHPSSGKFSISKVNEGWDAAGYYNSLRFQESLLDKEVFFDQFLGVILGGLSAQPYELGKTVHEKVANFVNNRSDVDKVNVDALLSLCNELTLDFEEYNYLYPPQLKRLVDLLSIKQRILWGTQNKYALNFDNRGTTFPNDEYGINLNSKIDILTGIISPYGIPIVAKELFSNTYKIINTNYIPDIEDLITISGSITGIPLSAYTPDWGWGLIAPDNITGIDISVYYEFYSYNPVFNNMYYDNIIDWDSDLTTLTPQNSSYTTWSADEGIMQNILSYELTKGFRLFTSAANITYNS